MFTSNALACDLYIVTIFMINGIHCILYIHTYLIIFIYIYIYIYIYINIHIYIYINIQKYIYIYTYINKHVYIALGNESIVLFFMLPIVTHVCMMRYCSVGNLLLYLACMYISLIIPPNEAS